MGRQPKASSIPVNWPPGVTYLKVSCYSKHLTTIQQTLVHTAPPSRDSPVECLAHIPPVSIDLIVSPSHPAFNQRGLFANQHLAPETFVLFYLGYLHTSLAIDNDPDSDYDLSMDREAGLAIDATQMGNEARFVNDYRGVPGRETKGPNCEFKDCWVKLPGGRWERRVGVYVLPAGRAGKRKAGISEGEEILVSYGKGFWCKNAGKEAADEGGVIQSINQSSQR